MARTVRCGVFGRGMAGMSGSGAVSWGEVCYGEVGFVRARHGRRGESWIVLVRCGEVRYGRLG